MTARGRANRAARIRRAEQTIRSGQRLSAEDEILLSKAIHAGQEVEAHVPANDRTDSEQETVDEGCQATIKFATANIDLVYFVRWQQFRTSQRQKDLFQAGCVGLSVAVSKYDGTRGNRFSTMAIWWIKCHMQAEQAFNSSITMIRADRYSRQLRELHGDPIDGEGAVYDEPESHPRWGMFYPDAYDVETAESGSCIPENRPSVSVEDEVLTDIEPFGILNSAVDRLPFKQNQIINRKIGRKLGDYQPSYRELALWQGKPNRRGHRKSNSEGVLTGDLKRALQSLRADLKSMDD